MVESAALLMYTPTTQTALPAYIDSLAVHCASFSLAYQQPLDHNDLQPQMDRDHGGATPWTVG